MDYRYYYLKVGIIATIGMIFFVSFLGNVAIPMSALELELNIQLFSQGYTEVVIPPFGTVRAQTHISPLQFQVILQNINLDLLQEAIPDLSKEEFIGQLQKQIMSYLYYFFFRIMALGFLGGAAAVYLSGIKKFKTVAVGGIIGLVIIGLLILAAVVSYNPQAFVNPEFEGVLSSAPWMVSFIEESLLKVDTLGEQMELMAINISRVYERIDQIEPLDRTEGDLKVLHISDIHNNPAAIKYVIQVVNTFNVDMVIDTGDITDFGTPMEAELVSRISNIKVPYVFVPGNHDSPEVIDRMKEIEQVIVLEEDKINIKGLNIAGIADPSSRSKKMAVASQWTLNEYARRLKEIVEKGDLTHIVATHHAGISKGLIGEVPVILHGHTHSLDIREENKSVIIDAGTAGAAGVRGLQSHQEVPYGVVLLHFNMTEKVPRLIAADIIKVFQLHSGFNLKRVRFNEGIAEEGILEESIINEDILEEDID